MGLLYPVIVGGVQDEKAFGGRRSITAVASFTFRVILWNHKALNRKYKVLAKPIRRSRKTCFYRRIYQYMTTHITGVRLVLLATCVLQGRHLNKYFTSVVQIFKAFQYGSSGRVVISLAMYGHFNVTYFRSVCAVCYDGSVSPFMLQSSQCVGYGLDAEGSSPGKNKRFFSSPETSDRL